MPSLMTTTRHGVRGRRWLDNGRSWLRAHMDPYGELTCGWRYCATLQLTTPLACLECHGEFRAGENEPELIGPPESHLADGTPFNSYGIWVREIDYGAMGFTPPPPARRATQNGPVEAGSNNEKRLLSFLNSFRYIVETAGDIDQALSELFELSESSPGNRQVWQEFSRSDPEFPHSFFINRLVELPGVGAVAAKNLYQAGFRSPEQVLSADDQALLSVRGVGKSLIAKLRDG
jgi:hypothetical protein